VTCVDLTTGVQTTETVWITHGGSAPTPGVDPYALAVRAERTMVLPQPVISTDPAATTVVNLATWLWVQPSLWHTRSETVSADGVTATAVATPVAVEWSTGDGGSIRCPGPGAVYEPSLPPAAQSTTCSHRYLRSSIGEPSPDGRPDDAAFPLTATVEWSVSWSSVGAPGGGSLPPLTTSSTTSIRVEQIESIDGVPADGIGGLPLGQEVVR
jgi:hypothetical protein